MKAREETLRKIRRRQEIFEELLESGVVDSASLEANNEHNIVRLLDSLVVKLEVSRTGGDDRGGKEDSGLLRSKFRDDKWT